MSKIVILIVSLKILTNKSSFRLTYLSFFGRIAKQFWLMEWWFPSVCLSRCLTSVGLSVRLTSTFGLKLCVQVVEFALQSGQTIAVFVYNLFHYLGWRVCQIRFKLSGKSKKISILYYLLFPYLSMVQVPDSWSHRRIWVPSHIWLKYHRLV